MSTRRSSTRLKEKSLKDIPVKDSIYEMETDNKTKKASKKASSKSQIKQQEINVGKTEVKATKEKPVKKQKLNSKQSKIVENNHKEEVNIQQNEQNMEEENVQTKSPQKTQTKKIASSQRSEELNEVTNRFQQDNGSNHKENKKSAEKSQVAPFVNNEESKDEKKSNNEEQVAEQTNNDTKIDEEPINEEKVDEKVDEEKPQEEKTEIVEEKVVETQPEENVQENQIEEKVNEPQEEEKNEETQVEEKANDDKDEEKADDDKVEEKEKIDEEVEQVQEKVSTQPQEDNTESEKNDNNKEDTQVKLNNIKIILLDIEGTTAPKSFVSEKLTTYSKEQLEAHITSTFESSESKSDLEALYKRLDNSEIKFPETAEELKEGNFISEIVKYIQSLIDSNEKVTELNNIQERIWKFGYEGGEIKGVIYEDVLPQIKAWQEKNIKIAVYSSASIQAQKLLFQYSEQGDITQSISNYYDTNTGSKEENASYENIIKDLQVTGEEVVFLTDKHAEGLSAQQAGVQVVISQREGAESLPEDNKFQTFKDFTNLEIN